MRLLLHGAKVDRQQIKQPTIKAFSDLGDANEDSRLGRPLVTPGDTKVERVGATGRAELETVMADTGVNVGTNAGMVNVPEATEETPSLVLALEVDAEESKGCGAPLAETPGTEEACEEVFLWIDEIMVGMEFPIARTTASVRESAN